MCVCVPDKSGPAGNSTSTQGGADGERGGEASTDGPEPAASSAQVCLSVSVSVPVSKSVSVSVSVPLRQATGQQGLPLLSRCDTSL